MRALPVCKSVGWARVDAKPLKKSLEGLVAKWSYLFIRYLQDKVTTEMDSLYAFMGGANEVLGLAVGREGGVAEESEEEAAAADAEAEDAEGGDGVDPAERRAAEEAEARAAPFFRACVLLQSVTRRDRAWGGCRRARTCTGSWARCATSACAMSARRPCLRRSRTRWRYSRRTA